VRRGGSVVSLLLLLAVAGGSMAQERLGFFACGEVRFFGEACLPSMPLEVSPPLPAETPREEPPQPEPLFTPETVAPTTPPVVLRLLQEPTEAHARAFLAWQQARLYRLREVQALLKRLQATAPASEPVVP
jgi:hypothetical protein